MPEIKKPKEYYTLIFILKTTGKDKVGFTNMLSALIAEAKTIDGFLGEEGIVDFNGTTILLSYWRDKKSIQNWQDNNAHQAAREKEKNSWLSDYEIQVGKVIKEYSGPTLKEQGAKT